MKEPYLPARNRTKKVNRAVRTILPLVCLLALLVFSICLAQGDTKRRVLIYTKNGEGYVHDNIPASVVSLKSICEKNDWAYEVSEDASIFTSEKIDSFDVLVFSNTNNEVFDTNSQRDVFQNYIRQGGGFVGIHSACGSERDWPWFWANLGGKFLRHPEYQKFDVKIIDSNHPSTCFLESVWKWEDECYYLNHLNSDIRVLLAADLTTIEDDKKGEYPGEIFGRYFPLAWYHEFEGGRQWYTALGHSPEHYEDDNFKKHLAGGIRWAMRVNKSEKN